MSIPKKSINTANLILTKTLTEGTNVHIYLFTLHHERNNSNCGGHKKADGGK